MLNAVASCSIWFFKFLKVTTWLWTIALFFTIYFLIKASKQLSWSFLVFLYRQFCWWNMVVEHACFVQWILQRIDSDYSMRSLSDVSIQGCQCLSKNCSGFVCWSCPYSWLRLDSQDNYQTNVFSTINITYFNNLIDNCWSSNHGLHSIY